MSKSTYKELENELQQVLLRVEESSYDELDDLLADYDKGIELVASLEKKLATAKNKIVKVSGSNQEDLK